MGWSTSKIHKKNISINLKNNKQNNLIDYILVLILIAVTGIPFFYFAIENIIIAFIVAFVVALFRGFKFNFEIVTILLLFIIVDILQSIIFKYFSITTTLGSILRISLAFLVLGLCGIKFTKYFTNIIYYFAIVSFVFFIPCILSSDFYYMLKELGIRFFQAPFNPDTGIYKITPNIILFTVHPVIVEGARNPGPFWEPGGFGIFLVIALMFNLIDKKRIFSKQNVILLIAILSTLSTATYLSTIVLILFFLLHNKILKFRYLYSFMLTLLALFLIFNLDFLSEKIEKNIDDAYTSTSSRFGSAVQDLNEFWLSPLVGVGKGYSIRTYRDISLWHRNNGLTGLLKTYGIIFFIYYFYLYYNGLRNYCIYKKFNSSFAFFGLIIFLILGFSQSIFLRPFFFSLLFLGGVIKKEFQTISHNYEKNINYNPNT